MRAPWIRIGAIIAALSLPGHARAAEPITIPSLPVGVTIIPATDLTICYQPAQALNTRTRNCTIKQVLDAITAAQITTALGYTPVSLSGGTLTGELVLAGDPVAVLGAATKQYVDARVLVPGGSSGQGQYNNGGVLAGYTVGGDCTANFTTGAFTCTKTGGVTLGALATQGVPGSNTQIIYNSGGSLVGMTAVNGDCTLNTSSGVMTCTKTNGVSYGSFATGTDAANLTGTVSVNRFNGGSGATSSTFLSGAGTWTTPTASASALTVNAQTGTTYTVVNGDLGKLITLSNASATTVTLPQAGAGGNFTSGWYAYFENINAGEVTITPTTSTIKGATTLQLTRNTSALVISDGANYYALVFSSGGTGGSSASLASVNVTSTGGLSAAIAASTTAVSTLSGTSSAIIAVSGAIAATVSGGASALVAGGSSTISGDTSAGLALTNATISGTRSAGIAGSGSLVSGHRSAALGGLDHTISGAESVALGGSAGRDRGRAGAVVQGGGYQGAASLTQLSLEMVLAARIQNTSATELSYSAGASYLSLADNTAMNVQIQIVCQNRSNVADNATFVLMTSTNPGAMIYRGAGVATTAVGGSPVFNAVSTSGNGTELSATFTADTANGRAAVKITASSSRDWFCGAKVSVVETQSN